MTVTPLPFPIGVYANKINLNGTPQTFQQSVFSVECVTGRDKMTFSGTDAFYGIPAAAHSTKFISTGSNTPCQPNAAANIHRSAGGTDTTSFATAAATTAITTRSGYSSGELAAGLSVQLTPMASFYGEVGKVFKLGGGETQLKASVQGSVGLRLGF